MEPDEFILKFAYAFIALMLILALIFISVIFFGPDGYLEELIENVIETESGIVIDFTPDQ